MTRDELTMALAGYRAGLETQITLLRRLEAVAAKQRAATEARDFDQLARESDARDRLMQALVALEFDLRPVRTELATVRDAARTIPGYDAIVELRDLGAALVTGIVETDRESMRALTDAELARRTAAATLEQGEATLAAYRKVLTPPVGRAFLDQRG